MMISLVELTSCKLTAFLHKGRRNNWSFAGQCLAYFFMAVCGMRLMTYRTVSGMNKPWETAKKWFSKTRKKPGRESRKPKKQLLSRKHSMPSVFYHTDMHNLKLFDSYALYKYNLLLFFHSFWGEDYHFIIAVSSYKFMCLFLLCEIVCLCKQHV